MEQTMMMTDEMQLAAQTAQQIESRWRGSLNYAELASQRGKRYPASDTGNAETVYWGATFGRLIYRQMPTMLSHDLAVINRQRRVLGTAELS